MEKGPPPELCFEIDISRGVLNRLGIYAALRIPEVWSFDRQALKIRLLQNDGSYRIVESSPTFPTISIAGIVPYLRPSETEDFMGMVRAFRSWVQEQMKAGK